jgi:hypothetical protein
MVKDKDYIKAILKHSLIYLIYIETNYLDNNKLFISLDYSTYRKDKTLSNLPTNDRYV